MAEMHQRIKTRREFALESPVLQLGEHGLESDTLFFKIGDGKTRWNSLDYYGQAFSEGGGTTPPAPSGNFMVVAPHGNDANYARPTGTLVYWLGDAEPVNALDDDLWSGGVLP